MKLYILYILALLFFGSCVINSPNASFVGSSYEPIIVTKKKEFQTSFGLRPFKYCYADLTYAISDKIAVKLNAGGFYQLGNFMASTVYYKNLPKLNYYIGGLFNFQTNQINRTYGDGIGTSYVKCNYSCIYSSPGIVIGLNKKVGENSHHQFIVKCQYNIVNKYEYYYTYQNRYEALQDEHFSFKIPNFFSLEPSYSFLTSLSKNKKNFLKLQIRFNITEKTYRHNYSFGPSSTFYGYPYYKSDQTNLHPVSFPVNLSIGYIFFAKRD